MTMLEMSTRSADRGELLDAVEALRPMLEDGALEAEEQRTLPRRCVEAMRAANLFAIASPKEVGGLEVDPLTHLEVIEAVARIDSSAGWTLMIGSTSTSMIGTFGSDETCRAVFGDGRWPIAGSQMAPWAGRFRPVDGGFRLTGRWAFASGVSHSDWTMVTATEAEPVGAPRVLAAVFPTSAVTIHDNWHVAGMKGTGSSDFSLDEAFVPAGMTYLMPHRIRRGGPRYKLKMPQATLAAFALGLARRSLDEVTAQSLAKFRPGVPNAVAARPFFHHWLGEAEMRLSAARAGLYQLVDSMWQLALRDQPIPVELDLRLTASPAYVHAVAAEITATAFRFGGSSAARLDNVLQRNVRDMIVASAHFQASEHQYEALGQRLLGLDRAST